MTIDDTTLSPLRVPSADDLDWSDSSSGRWRVVRDQYVDKVAATLSGVSAKASTAAADRLVDRLSSLSESDLTGFLTAPRVSSLVLWSRGSGKRPDDVLNQISDLAELEPAHPAAGQRAGWVALGDSEVTSSGRRRQPTIEGLPPLDFNSPHARTIDLTGDSWFAATPRPAMSPQEQEGLLGRLASASRMIAAAGGGVTDFVRLFTLVLVGQFDAADDRPSSGTCWQYVGQSVIANFRPGRNSNQFLAEAIVHESIHGYLFMLEHEEEWVLDPGLYETTPRVRSPWSGRLLPIRPYLQACHVWFGLNRFWSLALANGATGPEPERRLEQTRSGFCAGGLREHLGPYEKRVAPAIVKSIDEMQRRVVG